MSNPTAVRGGIERDPIKAPTALYRYFDADMTLVYVGISKSPSNRHADHREKSVWMQFVAGPRSIEWFPDRPSAIAAETEAILNEKPLFNIDGNQTVEASVRLAMYLSAKGEWTLVEHGHDRSRGLSVIDLYEFGEMIEEELQTLSYRRPRMHNFQADYWKDRINLGSNFATDEKSHYWFYSCKVYTGAGRLFVDEPMSFGEIVRPPAPRFAASGRNPAELAYNLVQDIDANVFALIDTGKSRTPYDVPKTPWPRRKRPERPERAERPAAALPVECPGDGGDPYFIHYPRCAHIDWPELLTR